MANLVEQQRMNPSSGMMEVYFLVQWKENRRRRTKALGFCERSAALRAKTVIEERVARGLPADPGRPPSSPTSSQPRRAMETEAVMFAPPQAAPTLGAFLDEVFMPVHERDHAERTNITARVNVKTIKRILGEGMPLDAINYAKLDGFITVRRGEDGRQGKTRAKTIVMELQLLKAALKLAVNHELLTKFPKFPKNPKDRYEPPEFLTAEQQLKLLEAMRPEEKSIGLKRQSHRDPLSYLAVVVGLNTGMRREAILTRRWEDINWRAGSHGVLRVRPNEFFAGKNRAAIRDIPLAPELRTALGEAWAAAGRPTEGWIFPSRFDPNKPRSNFRTALERACKDAGVPVISPHGLRHSWASRMVMEGRPRKWIIEVGGWTDGAMLDRIYSHLTSEQSHQVMETAGIGLSDARDDDEIDGGGE